MYSCSISTIVTAFLSAHFSTIIVKKKSAPKAAVEE
jgi:hypothetical protein